VLHELAHAWQLTVRGYGLALSDVSGWGKHGLEGLEAAADSVAAVDVTLDDQSVTEALK
jgi:hypothetical protein